MSGISPALLAAATDTKSYLEACCEISVLLSRISSFITGLISGCIVSLGALIGHGHRYLRLRRTKMGIEKAGVHIFCTYIINIIRK